MVRRSIVVLALLCCLPSFAASRDVFDRVRDGFADSKGVRIHYAELGHRGPLIVMIHGFPDFWYTWRDQMAALSRRYHLVAIDQRGYNLSDQPDDVAQYDITILADDVAAVIRDVGQTKAVIVGHDWGGAVAWQFSMQHPEMTVPLVQTPVLCIHGLDDPFLLAAGWNSTWTFLAKGMTLVTIPGASHFVQRDASELVTKTIKNWLIAEGVR